MIVIRDLYTFLFNISPQNLVVLAVVIGLILTDDLNANEQNSLGNFIMLIAQAIETSASQLQLLEARNNSQKIKKMQHDIDNIKQRLNIE